MKSLIQAIARALMWIFEVLKLLGNLNGVCAAASHVGTLYSVGFFKLNMRNTRWRVKIPWLKKWKQMPFRIVCKPRGLYGRGLLQLYYHYCLGQIPGHATRELQVGFIIWQCHRLLVGSLIIGKWFSGNTHKISGIICDNAWSPNHSFAPSASILGFELYSPIYPPFPPPPPSKSQRLQI